MQLRGGPWQTVLPQLCTALLFGIFAHGVFYADSKESKPAPAADYVGHIASARAGLFVVHVDAFTPDDAANAVALKGRDGDSNAIRTALGNLDAGFIKIGATGYRVAYARRRQEKGGVRIILIIRNELRHAGRTNGKVLVIPPLAAVDIWIPPVGEGGVRIASAAEVVFHSADEIAITDWGAEQLRVLDLTTKKSSDPA